MHGFLIVGDNNKLGAPGEFTQHLDKSTDWAADELKRKWGIEKPKLSEDEKTVESELKIPNPHNVRATCCSGAGQHTARTGFSPLR